MTKPSPVLQYWKLGFDLWRMSVEAQAIMTMRLTGMAGFWTPARGETTRMVREKQEAFADAFMRAGVKALQGQPPDQVMRAALDRCGARPRETRVVLENQYVDRCSEKLNFLSAALGAGKHAEKFY